MSRRQMREHCFCLLYNLGFYQDAEYAGMIEGYFVSSGIDDEQDRDQIRARVLAVMDESARFDAMIDERSEHWKTARIAKVDLAIIRLALYEMLEDDEIPVGVAINEAVRLAKKYSSDKASAFVNGVLAAFVPEES